MSIYAVKKQPDEDSNSLEPSMAIMVQNSSNNTQYDKWTSETWPASSNYQLNIQKSSCNGNTNVGSYISYSSNNIAINNASKTLKCTLYFDKVLSEPIVTIKTVDGSTETDYQTGTWTNKNVKITLSSSETGVTYQYSTDGHNWSNYSSPITLSSDTNAVYRFKAIKGNQSKETSKTYEIKIDKTPPKFDGFILGNSINYDSTSKIYYLDVYNIQISDGEGSGYVGTYSVYYRHSGTNDAFKLLGSSYNSQTKKIELSKNYEIFELKFVAKDNAGNETSTTYDLGSYCFVAGTKVLTQYGYKNIEDIKAGDLVWTISEETGEKELKPVLHTTISNTDEIYEIKVGDEIIKATPRHRFYVVDKGWTRAYNIKKGDYLISADNMERQKIEEVVHKTNLKTTKVYNLAILDNHNYLVSTSEILVHNVGSDN